MIFSALKKFFGIESNPEDQQKSRFDPSLFRPPSNDENLPFNRQSVPFGFSEFEADINQFHEMMNQQIHSILGSFGSILGPGPQFGGDNDLGGQGQHPRSPFIFGFPGFPSFPGMPGMSDVPGIHGPQIPGFNTPALPGRESDISPRDEVLKPKFRKNPSEMKDVDLDDIVREQGPGIVMDLMKPDEGLNQPLLVDPQSRSGFTSSTTITVYSSINGKSTMERIIVHPDQRVERYRMESDENSQPQLE